MNTEGFGVDCVIDNALRRNYARKGPHQGQEPERWVRMCIIISPKGIISRKTFATLLAVKSLVYL